MEKLIKIFESLNIPIIYINTSYDVSVPFGIYQRLADKVIYSDNKAFVKIYSIKLDIYYNNLVEQLKLEEELEQKLLESKFITFRSSEEILLDDKKTKLKYYEIEVLKI